MRADRLVAIMMLLQARGRMTTAALADELEVSRRTILRDIEALSTSGVLVFAEGGHGGGVALDEGYRTSLTGLKEAEVRALFISAGDGLLQQLGLADDAQAAQRKLEAALPSSQHDALAHMRQRVHIDTLWWWHESEAPPFWNDLQTAVYSDREIRIRYEKYNGDMSERTVEPYSLVAKAGAWYLLAKHGDAIKTYRVARIQSLRVLDSTFIRAADFDLGAHWSSHLDAFKREFAVFAFTIKIHPERQPYMRWMMPGRSRLVHTDPDSGWLSYDCDTSGMDQALMMVFGLGDDVEILEPQSLRAAMREACLKMAKKLEEHAAP
jgi:predicted DNA-binding transcriptional regulator YafY